VSCELAEIKNQLDLNISVNSGLQLEGIYEYSLRYLVRRSCKWVNLNNSVSASFDSWPRYQKTDLTFGSVNNGNSKDFKFTDAPSFINKVFFLQSATKQTRHFTISLFVCCVFLYSKASNLLRMSNWIRLGVFFLIYNNYPKRCVSRSQQHLRCSATCLT